MDDPRIFDRHDQAHAAVRREGLVQDWQKGKKQSLGFLVGQVMKATHGKANPALVNELLVEKLQKS